MSATDKRLERIRTLVERYYRADLDEAIQLAATIIDNFEVLDKQLVNGAPLPSSWANNREVTA